MSKFYKNKKNLPTRFILLISLFFSIGFVVASISVMLIFYDEIFDGDIQSSPVSLKNDSRLITNETKPSLPPKKEIYTDIGKEKEEFLLRMVSEPKIQLALKNSNSKEGKMSPDIRRQIYLQYEKEWTQAQENTPFMDSIIDNDVSHFLLGNHVIQSEKFGYLSFGEHILTNVYGANVAVSIKTDNFDQSNDDWWQIAYRDKIGEPFARQCEFDSSASMFSEDLVVRIKDNETGEFIGILNSATPCNVTKESENKTGIVPVAQDNVTPKGLAKIHFLKELVTNPIIQSQLKKSNEKFLDVNKEELSELKRKTEWPKPGMGEINSLQVSVLNNTVSDLLRKNMVENSTEFGQLVFPEMILTNAKGVNTASTGRTFDYIQYFEDWWQVAVENDGLVRNCGKDITINTTSEDIIIKIHDERGAFIGILNAATSCDVVLNKPPVFYGDSN